MSSSSRSSLLWKMSTVKSWRQFLQNNQVNNYFSYNTWNRNYGFLRQTGNQPNQSKMVTHDWLSPDLNFVFQLKGKVMSNMNKDIKMSEVANTKILYQQCSVANIPHVDYEHCLQISPCSSGCESFSTSGC